MDTRTHKQRFRRLAVVAAMAVAVTTALAGAALADDVSNDLDASVDAVAEVMALNVGGASGTTQLYVVPRNGDGKNGCNLTGSTTLVVSVSSSNPAVATVSPPSITFGSCNDTPTVTVTPLAEGSATISVSQVSNNTDGTFNLAPATFTANVAPPANTAPHVSVSGVSGGASYAKGSVPAAGCEVTDAEDGDSSFAATLGAVSGPYASDGIGSQEASCTYTDGGGLTATASATYSIVDPSAPSIDHTLSPGSPDGDNGWYTSDVTLTWSVGEPESPNSLQQTGCVDQNVTADQQATTYTCSASSAGGSTGPVSVSIKRDATPPGIAGAVAPGSPNGSNGWYTTAPTVTFSCSDATSGIAGCVVDGSSPASDSVTLGESASAQSVGGTATDNAGNTSSASVAGLKVDLSDPTISSWNGSISDGAAYYYGFVPAAPTCTGDDAVSGLASCTVTGYGNAIGSHTLTATATDNAGRTASQSRSYTVLAWTIRGFFQPVDTSSSVWNTVKSGSTVPLKFRVFAGSTELVDVSAVSSVSYRKVTCAGAAIEDAIEELASPGSTILRYDPIGGQFVYNLKTSGGAGECYRATLTTADGSILSANIKLR